jgi:hypothetical protein
MSDYKYLLIASSREIEKRLETLKQELEKYDFAKPLQIFTKVYSGARSNSQNALSHVWYRVIAEWCRKNGINYTLDGKEYPMHEDDIKTMLKGHFLATKYGEIKGKPVTVTPETSSLTKSEMFDFMTNIHVWASERGIVLPLPEDNEFTIKKMNND